MCVCVCCATLPALPAHGMKSRETGLCYFLLYTLTVIKSESAERMKSIQKDGDCTVETRNCNTRHIARIIL